MKTKFKNVDDYQKQIDNAIPGKDLLKIIRHNRDLLNACKQHHFDMSNFDLYTTILHKRKLYCLNCGGVMDTTQAFEYVNGYKAAGGNPKDVIENFQK